MHNNPKVGWSKYLLMDEWINKVHYINTVEYYSALKRKFWHLLNVWILKTFMLSEVSPLQKGKYYVIPLT